MTDLQRYVVDQATAERMFPTTEDRHTDDGKTKTGWTTYDPEATWLAGPITCETCDGTGDDPLNTQRSPAFQQVCPACLGLGYPSRLKIVSERIVWTRGEPFKVHGIVLLGKRVPVVERDSTNIKPRIEPNRPTDPAPGGVYYFPGDELMKSITGRLSGPVKPGDVAYPLTVET